jgi:hypothetical protein
MSRLSEQLAFVPLLEPKDKTASAYVSDAVDLSLYHSFTVILLCGAITGDSVLTVYRDTTAALATSLTTAVAFTYRLSAAAFKVTKADQLGAATAVASTGLTMTAATFNNKWIAIEFDCDIAGSTARFATINLSSVGNPMLVAAIGVGKSRYPGNLIPTAV